MRGDDRRQVIEETSRRRNQGDDVLWEQTKESTGRKHQAEVMKRGVEREIVEERSAIRSHGGELVKTQQ